MLTSLDEQVSANSVPKLLSFDKVDTLSVFVAENVRAGWTRRRPGRREWSAERVVQREYMPSPSVVDHTLSLPMDESTVAAPFFPILRSESNQLLRRFGNYSKTLTTLGHPCGELSRKE